MKKIFFDIKKGTAKIKPENTDDLWSLSQIIEEGDEITGRTFRKIKLGGATERAKTEKKPVTLTIKTEKTEFTENTLRASGKTTEPAEDIPKDSHHTITIEENSIIQIKKEKWQIHQKQRLEETFNRKQKSILIIAFDRENALFAITKQYGYEILTTIEGEVQKKDERAASKGNFYEEIIKLAKEYAERYNAEHIIAGSPAFWKEELAKKISDPELKKKIVYATCHSAEETAIKEILKREEIQTILKEEQLAKQTKLVDKLLEEISKDGKAVYGQKETQSAVNAGAAAQLLISDDKIKKARSEKDKATEEMMKTADELGGEIHIISSAHEAGKKLDGLGGTGAILRYKIY
jgi:protein pelota